MIVDPAAPDRPDHEAAFFFLGALEPAELARFKLSNVFLPGEADSAVLEVLGHGASIWWKRCARRDFLELRDATRDWLETIAAAYYLSTDQALGVRLAYWVETLVRVDEAVVGFMDSRFRIIDLSASDTPASDALRRAVDTAGALRGRGHMHRAAKEAWRSRLDPTDEAFLSAFRALECLRRLYSEGEKSDELAAGWAVMEADLEAERPPFEDLRDAAKAIRHGDRPASRTEAHAVNDARARREELLTYATDLVRTRLTRDLERISPSLG